MPPEFNPLNVFDPSGIVFNRWVRSRQDRRYGVGVSRTLDEEYWALLKVIFSQGAGIPKPDLWYYGIQAQFVEISNRLLSVNTATVPNAVVHDEYGSRFAGDVLLPPDVLIPGNGRFAHYTKVSSGYEARTPHGFSHFLRVVKELDIEGRSRVNGRILMQMLGFLLLPSIFVGLLGW